MYTIEYNVLSMACLTLLTVPANVHHSIFKQDQVHGCNKIIVTRHGLSQKFIKFFPISNRHVLWFTNTTGKVAEDVWFFEYYAFVYLLKNTLY